MTFFAGKIGIGVHGVWFEPERAAEPSINDTIDWALQLHVGWMVNTLLKTGDYPVDLKAHLGNKLPSFTKEQTRLLKGKCSVKHVCVAIICTNPSIDDWLC